MTLCTITPKYYTWSKKKKKRAGKASPFFDIFSTDYCSKTGSRFSSKGIILGMSK